MNRAIVTAPSMDEVIRGLPTAHTRAADNQTSVSIQLEVEQPSDMVSRDADRGYDAFGRVLEHLGIVTRDNPAAGVYSLPLGRLLDGEHIKPDGQKIGREMGRAVANIWAERTWRRVKYGKSPNTRALFVSEDTQKGGALNPWSDASTIRDVLDRNPNIPLPSLVAQETNIDGTGYKMVYVDETSVGTFDYRRVTEAADIPTVDLRTSERTVRIHKRGRAINWSYEAGRAMRLDKFQLIIEKMAFDVEAGKVGDLVEAAMAGNDVAPTVYNLSDLDESITPGATAVPTLRSILTYKKMFRGAFRLTTILGNLADITDLEMIEIGLDSTPWVALPAGSAIGGLRPLNDQRTGNDIGYADLDAGLLPAGTVLGFDARWAIERISQIGATISEADNFIHNQTNLLTFTDTDGFDVMFAGAIHPLNLDA